MEPKLVYAFSWSADGEKGMALFAGPGAEEAARISEAAPELCKALKRIVLAYDQGRDLMAKIAMDALDAAGAAPASDGRNTPTAEIETPS